jgi:type III restriction enzyme
MFKDTRGDTHADDEVYNLIMRNKERLLSEDEPLRFIFTHSALREGWDNPNVFQICTLNETHSVIKKRQEIGRGLRLPVDQNGRRVFDESVNKLFVMANESYEDFARALQSEYEEDCGISFSKVPIAAIVTKDGASRVEGRTSTGLNDRRANAEAKCSVGSDTDALVERAIEGIRRMEKIEAPVVQVTAGQLAIKADGIAVRSTLTAKEVEAASLAPLPDILGFLESETELTRSTLVRILKGSGRLVELFVDPHRFMFAVAKVLKHQLAGPITSPERRFGPSQTPVPARQA